MEHIKKLAFTMVISALWGFLVSLAWYFFIGKINQFTSMLVVIGGAVIFTYFFKDKEKLHKE
jgi:hypothetical protein